jgi:hypothetical protein
MKVTYQLSESETFGFLGCIQLKLSVLVEVQGGGLVPRLSGRGLEISPGCAAEHSGIWKRPP